jgi:hypothetical protein
MPLIQLSASKLSPHHYHVMGLALANAVRESIRRGLLPRAPADLTDYDIGGHRPRTLTVFSLRSAAPKDSLVRLAVDNDSSGAYARLLIGDGNINLGEGIMASWSIHWRGRPQHEDFVVSGSRRQYPGGPLDGDWQPLQYDLPPFVLDGQAYQIDGHPQCTVYAGLTHYIMREAEHWLTTPAPAIPADADI